MPLSSYPPHLSALLSACHEKAVDQLAVSHPVNFHADEQGGRLNMLEGLLNAYDLGERREDKLIAAAHRRFHACDWTIAGRIAYEPETD